MKAVWKALHEMVAAKRNKALAASLGSLRLELDAQQNSGLESVQPMKGRLAAGWLRMTTAGAIQLLSANSSRYAAIRMKYSGPSA
jgi:hypothetical protein